MTQRCVLSNGVKIEFENQGIIIRPYEISTRSERHKFVYARAKISREAADLIQEKDAFYNPVFIKMGDVAHDRYYVPDDGIIYGDQQAWVEFVDPLKILENETIEGSYHSVQLGDIVSDILEARNDPNGLITGVEIVDSDAASQYSETMRGELGRYGVPDLLARGWAALSKIGAYFQRVEIEEGGFLFEDDTSLYDALSQVEDEYGVISWVDLDGVLSIGFPELKSTNAIGIYGDPSIDDVNISGYNVSRLENSLSSLEGRSTPFSYLNGKVHPHTTAQDATYFIAKAEIPQLENNNRSLNNPVRVNNQEELESVVQRKFIDMFMNHNSGNIEFNGLASNNQDSLARLTVGDLIGVEPEIKRVCNRGIDGGAFVATQVQHKVNARVGWQITVSVSRLPPDDLRIISRVYDPSTQSLYKDLDDFEENQ